MFVMRAIMLPFRLVYISMKEILTGLFKLIRYLIKAIKDKRNDENITPDNTIQNQNNKKGEPL